MLGVSTDGAVTLLELRRPERRNAVDLDLCHTIRTAVDQAVAAGSRALVITGEGTAFCSGADLAGVYGPEFIDALYGMLHRLAAVPVPVVAAVNGPAIGAGTQLAVACDLRVVDETARFAVPTARNALAVDAWTIRTLARLAGDGPARRVLLAAETLDAGEALACGLADRPGTPDDALAWAHELAALAPLTLAYTKLVLTDRAPDGSPADDGTVSAAFDAVWASADVEEAARARAEKRPPRFRGR